MSNPDKPHHTQRPGDDDRSLGFAHTPVMLAEIVALFADVPPGLLVDATVGGGGHAEALLRAHPHLEVLGLDRDPRAVAAASKRLRPHGDRAAVVRSRFDELRGRLDERRVDVISGFLFDLGVSSPQLDEPERGFSYRQAGPLDMRMDPTQDLTAAELVNTLDPAGLASILERFGDERHAIRIARAIVASRPIDDTATLAAVVRDAIPAPARRRGGHPAKRTFQALRIAVNDELAQLPGALGSALDRLDRGGRGAVLAYHSGEDRIVKTEFARATGADQPVPRGLPVQHEAPAPFTLLWRGARRPNDREIRTNPRAESARLRAIARTTARAA